MYLNFKFKFSNVCKTLALSFIVRRWRRLINHILSFWLRQEPSKCKCSSVRSSVRLFDDSLSRALNFHLKAVWQSQVSPRSVPGQSQVSLRSVAVSLRSVLVSLRLVLGFRSVSGQTHVSLRSDSGQSQVSPRSVPGQSQVSLKSLWASSRRSLKYFFLLYITPTEHK